MTARPVRAVLFVDGSNWHHSVRDAGVKSPGELSYAKLSKKLIGPGGEWIGTRYYIGRVNQHEAPTLYARQRQFLARLSATDSRITTHLGRLETHFVENAGARELREFLTSLTVRIDRGVFRHLLALSNRHARVRLTREKTVDTQIAVDMVVLAQRDTYDVAYLLSADGDFTPAVEAVRMLGKTAYAASPAKGARLAAAANAFIPLTASWFGDCYR